MRTCLRCLVTGLVLLSGLSTLATAQQATPQVEKRELIFCADRMSHEEREAYRTKMRAARTLEERQSLRAAHQTEMQARAAAQGGEPCVTGGRQRRGGERR